MTFWVVVPCSVVVRYQRFGGPYCLSIFRVATHHQTSNLASNIPPVSYFGPNGAMSAPNYSGSSHCVQQLNRTIGALLLHVFVCVFYVETDYDYVGGTISILLT